MVCVPTIGIAQAVCLRVYFHGDMYFCDEDILDAADGKYISSSLFCSYHI